MPKKILLVCITLINVYVEFLHRVNVQNAVTDMSAIFLCAPKRHKINVNPQSICKLHFGIVNSDIRYKYKITMRQAGVSMKDMLDIFFLIYAQRRRKMNVQSNRNYNLMY